MPAATAPDDDLGAPQAEGAGDAEALDLLAQAFVEQARRGTPPSIESVARAHPELASDIRELFPVLAVVEGVKAAPVVDSRTVATRPDRVGEYVLGRELGRGGMGSVHEGRHVGEGGAMDRVAVKLVHAHLLDRPEYVARFLQEAAAGRLVEHENVVRTLETGVVDAGDGEVPYILLEYVEGQDLRALLREVGVVPERLCRHVGTRLADALAAVHAAGIVHRDVKPENVVITNDETVKLMDLGVAVVQDRLQRLSQTGQFVGSLLYASPGQIAGDDPEPAWDLHALGILLYELASGTHPARDAGIRWLRANEVTRDALTRRDALAHLSPFFATVIDSLLSTDGGPVFASAAELRDVLSQGEVSSWWKSRRDASPTPSARRRRTSRSTAFYGRRAEWRELERALGDAVEGRGQVILLEGEAGIGKTRLLEEWAAVQRATQTAPRVVALAHAPGCVLGDEPQLAAALSEVVGEDDLEARLAELLASRARLAPALARKLRGAPAAAESVPYNAAWMHLLQALGRERPFLVLAEDLHFASPEDVDRFLYFARSAPYARLLLVGTFRPQPEPAGLGELGILEHVVHLKLDGLDTEACHALLLEATADTPQLEESVQSLAERSDRNPMLLLELARRARQRAGTNAEADTSVPDSIRGLLLARLAALDSADRDLLDVAACHGYEFDPVIVAQACDAGRVDALKRFGRMEREQGLLWQAGRQYRFQHHLIQEALHGDLHPALREIYHAALGDALEAAMPHPQGADTVMLCHQFLRGGEPSRARPHVREAMEHVERDAGAHLVAEEIANLALAVDGLLRGTDRAFALHTQGRFAVSAGRFEEAHALLEEASNLVRDSGEPTLESDVHVTLAWLARNREGIDAGIRHLERAAETARAASDVGRESVALSRLAVEHLNLGRLDEADRLLERAFEALGDDDQPHVLCYLKGDLASLRILQGRLEEAQALLDDADRIAHEIGDVRTTFTNAAASARLSFRRGRYAEALEHLRKSIEYGRRQGARHRDAFLLRAMGRCLGKLGRFDEATARFREALETARSRGDRVTERLVTIDLGALQAARGEVGDACDAIVPAYDEGKGLARDVLVQATDTYVHLLALLGRFEEGHRLLDAAEASTRDEGAPAFDLVLVAARARLLEHEGRHDDAHTRYEEAVAVADRAALLTVPHVFRRSRNLLGAGRGDEAEAGFRDVLAWARENGNPALSVLAQVHLAARFGDDRLAARVALERHEEHLTAEERIEAHFALWKADGDDASLEAARREFLRLQAAAPVEDRAPMREKVALFRRLSRS